MGGKDGAMTAAAAPTYRAAGATDPGRVRDANEDRFHVDAARGIFMVIDGIGGQAAGGEAAALALSMLRARLERETGPVDQRVRPLPSPTTKSTGRRCRGPTGTAWPASSRWP